MHQMVLVIMPPPEARNPIPYIETIMAPFDENLEVESYDTVCYCCSMVYGPRKSGCIICNDTGVISSTHNAIGQWDYWDIGGRWAGWMVGLDPNDLPSKESNNPYLNMAGGAYIPRRVIDRVTAVVCPEGKWHDLIPEHPCFSLVTQWRLLHQRYSDHVFVVCDAHV